MRSKCTNAVAVCVSLLLVAASGAVAQGRPRFGGAPPPPPPGPSGQRSPGGMSQPGGMSGPGFPRMPAPHEGEHRERGPREGSTATPHDANNPIRFGPVGRWWDDRQVVRSIGLSTEQQRRMDAIFNANKPAIVDSYKTYLREKAKLDELSKNSSADKSAMFAAIDSANQARANLQKATAQMLLEIRQQMEPEQIEKLEKLPQ